MRKEAVYGTRTYRGELVFQKVPPTPGCGSCTPVRTDAPPGGASDKVNLRNEHDLLKINFERDSTFFYRDRRFNRPTGRLPSFVRCGRLCMVLEYLKRITFLKNELTITKTTSRKKIAVDLYISVGRFKVLRSAGVIFLPSRVSTPATYVVLEGDHYLQNFIFDKL